MTLTSGIYQIDLDAYIRDPAPAPSLSASVANVLLTKSAFHAMHAHPRLNPDWEPESTELTELGTIVHAILLENDRSRLVVAPFDDWRTKAAREMRDEARAQGRIPVLAHRLADID